MGPRDVQALPDSCRTALLALLLECEHLAIGPWQWLLTLMAMLPKADGSDRAIGLVAFLVRLWGRLRGAATADLNNQERAGFWDTAVKNSSSLQAALKRALRAEACALLPNVSGLNLLLDIFKFYNSMDPAIL